MLQSALRASCCKQMTCPAARHPAHTRRGRGGRVCGCRRLLLCGRHQPAPPAPVQPGGHAGGFRQPNTGCRLSIRCMLGWAMSATSGHARHFQRKLWCANGTGGGHSSLPADMLAPRVCPQSNPPHGTHPCPQTHLITLPGAPVALAARGHQLAAVWHGGPPTAAGDQCLHYALYDVAGEKCASERAAKEAHGLHCALYQRQE